MTDVTFAVDSAMPATAEVQPGLTLYDDVCAWAGVKTVPVWLRYLGTGGKAATPLDNAEAAFLLGRGTRIGLIYNDSPLNGGTTGSYALGQQDATAAITRAETLKVPPGTYLVNDLEYEALGNLNGDHIAGWSDAMRASVFAGSGAWYANALDPRFGTAMAAAAARSPANVRRLGIWLASWIAKAPGVTAHETPLWHVDPKGPAGLPMTIRGQCYGWQFAGVCYGGVVDLSIFLDPLPGPGTWWGPPSTSVPVTAAGTLPETADPYAQIAWAAAYQRGVLDGTSPRSPITREDLAVVLDRLHLLG